MDGPSLPNSRFQWEIEVLPVGVVIQMQADHVVHHVKRISAIRLEIPAHNQFYSWLL